MKVWPVFLLSSLSRFFQDWRAPPDGHHNGDGYRENECIPADMFAQHQSRDGQRDKGLQKLHLTDAGDAAHAKADIPRKIGDIHRDEPKIGEGSNFGHVRVDEPWFVAHCSAYKAYRADGDERP